MGSKKSSKPLKIKKETILKKINSLKGGLMPRGAYNEVGQDGIIAFSNGRLLSYNGDISVSVPFDIGIKEGQIPSTEFKTLLEKLGDEEIEIQINKEELILSCRNTTATFFIQKKSPLIEQKYQNEKSTNLPNNFEQAISFCSFSSATEDLSRLLTSCLLIKEKYVTATDGARLTRYELSKTLPKNMVLYIPGRNVAVLADHKPKKIAETNSWLHFINENDEVFSMRKMIMDNYQFPDTELIINDFSEKKLIKIPDELIEAIEKASVLAEKFESSLSITVSFSNKAIECHGGNEIGKIDVKVKTEDIGMKSYFHVNPVYFSQILNKAESMMYDDKKSRLKFENENFVHILSLQKKNE